MASQSFNMLSRKRSNYESMMPNHRWQNKRSIEDHFDKAHGLEQTLLKAGNDKDLKEVRKITNFVDILYVHKKDQNGLGTVYCVPKDTLVMSTFQFFWEIQSQSQKPPAQNN